MTTKNVLKKNKEKAISICEDSLKIKKVLNKNKAISELKILSLLKSSMPDNESLFLHKENVKITNIQLMQNDFLFNIGTSMLESVKDSEIETHITNLVFQMEEQLDATRIVYNKTKKELEEKEEKHKETSNEEDLFSFNGFSKEHGINIHKTKLHVLKSFISKLNDVYSDVKYSMPRHFWEGKQNQ